MTPCSAAHSPGPIDHDFVVRRDGGVVARRDEDLIIRSNAASTSAFRWYAIARGSVYAPFTRRTRTPSAFNARVLLAASKRGLQHDAERPVTTRHSVSTISSVACVYCELSMSSRTKKPAGSARSTILRSCRPHAPVHVEAEPGQLERDVAIDPGCTMVSTISDNPGGGIGLRQIGDFSPRWSSVRSSPRW